MSKTHCAPRPSRPLTRRLGYVLALLLVPLAAQAAKTTVTTGRNLDFGSFAVLPSCANCTITIGTNGMRTASAGIYLLPSKGGQAGTFNVTCNGGGVCPYSASILGTTTIAAGSVTMTVGSFTTSKGSTYTPSTVSVGGVLTIKNSGSPAGTYSSGIFTVRTTTP